MIVRLVVAFGALTRSPTLPAAMIVTSCPYSHTVFGPGVTQSILTGQLQNVMSDGNVGGGGDGGGLGEGGDGGRMGCGGDGGGLGGGCGGDGEFMKYWDGMPSWSCSPAEQTPHDTPVVGGVT